MPTFGYADKVVSFTNSGAGPIDDVPYGGTYPGTYPVEVDLDVVLGPDEGPVMDFLSLPTGSQVTVAFKDELIIDGPGDDVFVQEVANLGEVAEVYVGSGGKFTLLGTAGGGEISSFDLADINYDGFVTQVRIVGLDNGGGSPGYDLVNVQGLTDAAVSVDENNDVTGGDGKDEINLGKGSDSFEGGKGKDKAFGGAGRDTLDGGAQRDFLSGQGGKDIIIGGNGNDKLKGGGGADSFVFDRKDGKDTIVDFKAGADIIEITSGANRYKQLDMDDMDNGVMVSFGKTTIMMRGIEMDDLSRDDFLF